MSGIRHIETWPMERLGEYAQPTQVRQSGRPHATTAAYPSAVTRVVAALEDQLGLQLLARTTRSVSLTERGPPYQEFAHYNATMVRAMRTRVRGPGVFSNRDSVDSERSEDALGTGRSLSLD